MLKGIRRSANEIRPVFFFFVLIVTTYDHVDDLMTIMLDDLNKHESTISADDFTENSANLATLFLETIFLIIFFY